MTPSVYHRHHVSLLPSRRERVTITIETFTDLTEPSPKGLTPGALLFLTLPQDEDLGIQISMKLKLKFGPGCFVLQSSTVTLVRMLLCL